MPLLAVEYALQGVDGLGVHLGWVGARGSPQLGQEGFLLDWVGHAELPGCVHGVDQSGHLRFHRRALGCRDQRFQLLHAGFAVAQVGADGVHPAADGALLAQLGPVVLAFGPVVLAVQGIVQGFPASHDLADQGVAAGVIQRLVSGYSLFQFGQGLWAVVGLQQHAGVVGR